MAWLRIAPDPLDRRIFPGMFMELVNPTRDALDYMGEDLAKGTGCPPEFTFADTLRVAINLVYEDLWLPFGDRLPSEGEIVRLRASMALAVDRVMGWVGRHGIGKLDTPEEDSAARQGWPDETGRGWTPPLGHPRHRPARLLGQTHHLTQPARHPASTLQGRCKSFARPLQRQRIYPGIRPRNLGENFPLICPDPADLGRTRAISLSHRPIRPRPGPRTWTARNLAISLTKPPPGPHRSA